MTPISILRVVSKMRDAMSGGAENRICKRCLLRDFDPKAYKETIEDYINRIKASDRTPEELYRERLNICTECDKLNQGTCQSCGCYVELRAASVNAGCPKKKW